MKKLLFITLLLLGAGSTAMAQGDLSKPLPRDPEVVVGKLPNGLTYYLRRNEVPKERAEFHLLRNVGSLVERDEESGLAHFLEHMNFQGTEHFPGHAITAVLERNGVLFGHDMNAVTNENETVYSLTDVPTTSRQFLDTCALILHDWLHCLTLDGVAIDNERGVITEEWNMRNTPEGRMQQQMTNVLLKNSRYVNREVIGRLDVIQHFPHQAIRDFYHKWYRCDLSAVVIVGDFDLHEMEERVKRIFSAIPAAEGDPELPSDAIPEHKEVYFCRATDKGAKSNSVYVITLLPERSRQEKQTHFYLREKAQKELFNRMLSKRLGNLLRQPNVPLLQAGISCGGLKRGYDNYQLGGMPKEGQETEALRWLLAENERLKRYGFSEDELADAKADFLRELKYATRSLGTLKNEVYVRDIRAHFLQGEPLVDLAYKSEVLGNCVPQISLEEMNALAVQWDTEKNKTVILTGKPEDLDYIDEEDLKEILEEVCGMELKPYVYERDTMLTKPLLKEPLNGSKIVAEKALPQFGAVEWTLANGVKVVFRYSEADKNSVVLNAHSPGGSSLYETEVLPSVDILGKLLPHFGIGDFDAASLQRRLAKQAVSCEVAVNELSETVKAEAVPEDLETMFTLLYMRFMKPRFDWPIFYSSVMQSQQMLWQMQNNPMQVMKDSITRIRYDHHPRMMLIDEEYLNRLDFKIMERVYRERFSDAGDFTFFISGYVDADVLKPLVEKYIGSIPVEGRHEKWIDRGVRGPKGITEREIEIEQDKATVLVNFSAPLSYNCRHNICNELLKTILQARYMETIRGKEGGTYVVNMVNEERGAPYNDYGLTVEFDCNPERASYLKEFVYREAERIRKEGPTAEELTKAVAAMRKKRGEARQTNTYWQNVLITYYRTGIDTNASANFEDIIDALTPKDLRQYARQLFGKANVIDLIFSPEE